MCEGNDPTCPPSIALTKKKKKKKKKKKIERENNNKKQGKREAEKEKGTHSCAFYNRERLIRCTRAAYFRSTRQLRAITISPKASRHIHAVPAGIHTFYDRRGTCPRSSVHVLRRCATCRGEISFFRVAGSRRRPSKHARKNSAGVIPRDGIKLGRDRASVVGIASGLISRDSSPTFSFPGPSGACIIQGKRRETRSVNSPMRSVCP